MSSQRLAFPRASPWRSPSSSSSLSSCSPARESSDEDPSDAISHLRTNPVRTRPPDGCPWHCDSVSPDCRKGPIDQFSPLRGPRLCPQLHHGPDGGRELRSCHFHGHRAIQSDEDVATTVGVNASRLKLSLFGISGMFTGATGAVSAWTLSAVLPETGFDITFSLRMLAMIIIGGAGTLLGPFLGAIIVYVPYNYFQTVQSLLGLQLAVIGALVLLIALFIPTGIVGTVRRYVPFLRRYIE